MQQSIIGHNINMDVNCSTVKMEPSVTSYHHRQSNDWEDYPAYVPSDSETTTGRTINGTVVDQISEYSNCVPVTSNSLDSSNGLNGSCAALDLNGTNGHHHQQHQSFHTLEPTDQTGLHNQQQMAYLSSSSSQSVTPIDMNDQDRIKLERKRQRNRIAASKCRKRKIEKITKLEEKVKQVKSENSELLMSINKYREQLAGLKQELIQHAKHGCPIPQSFQFMT